MGWFAPRAQEAGKAHWALRLATRATALGFAPCKSKRGLGKRRCFGGGCIRSTGIANPVTYTGRRLDDETGMFYFRNRYYHAQLGRFVSRDPIGYEGSEWNLYEYVDGRPLFALDPDGLFVRCPGKKWYFAGKGGGGHAAVISVTSYTGKFSCKQCSLKGRYVHCCSGIIFTQKVYSVPVASGRVITGGLGPGLSISLWKTVEGTATGATSSDLAGKAFAAGASFSFFVVGGGVCGNKNDVSGDVGVDVGAGAGLTPIGVARTYIWSSGHELYAEPLRSNARAQMLALRPCKTRFEFFKSPRTVKTPPFFPQFLCK